jgi:predicted RNA polymerase sigma factor
MSIPGVADRRHCMRAARRPPRQRRDLRRVGRRPEAATAYERALELAANAAERAFLGRLGEVRSAG